MGESRTVFNPLDKLALGESVANALLRQRIMELPKPRVRMEPFYGAGIYAIYYLGEQSPYAAYAPIAEANRDDQYEQPIYVGRAVPRGARKGGFGLTDMTVETALFDRLKDHASSIDQAENLTLADFRCRYLVVEDIWIPLGEALLIAKTRPIWNLLIDGYGNHDPGRGRYAQSPSRWDTLHHGRSWATRLRGAPPVEGEILELVGRFLHGEEVPTLTPEEAVLAEEGNQAV